MKRKPALLLALSLYSVPPSVTALGLGDIELRSSLNQPLDARIALKSWHPDELEDLKVNLAGQEHFDRVGVEQVPGLSDLVFQVVESSDGYAYIEVSTKSDFREPFLDFLVEVSWPQGRVLREYTLLLDPPLYGAAVAQSLRQPSAEKLVETGKVTESSPVTSTEKVSKETSKRTNTTVASPARPVVKNGSREALQETTSTSTLSDSLPPKGVERALTYGPTAAGDTLWQVASGIVGDSSQELNQLMLALFRSNPDAFLKNNMNFLKKGVVLQIPDRGAVSTIESSEALAEVKRHRALWEEYRQTVAARNDKQPSGALAGNESTSNSQGQNETTATGERVKLVSAGLANSGVGSGAEADSGVEGLQNALALATEEAEATKRENQDLSERLSDAETIINDLRRLIDLKDDTISSLQNQLSADSSNDGVPAAESADDLEGQASDTNVTDVSVPADDELASGAQASATNLLPEALGQDEAARKTESGYEAGAEEIQDSAAVTRELTADQDLATEEVSKSLDLGHQVVPPNRSLPIGLGLFGGLLVAVSGFAVWRRRRAKAESLTSAEASPLKEDAASIDGSQLVAIDAEGHGKDGTDAGDESLASPALTDVDEGETTSSSDGDLPEEDPLAEVNVYLAYERFEQAEQLVKEAIENYPSRHEYKLKLLEILVASQNAAAFKTHARALRNAVGDENPLMEKAVAWWRDLCPGRDLFVEDLSEQDGGSSGERDEEAELAPQASPDMPEEGDPFSGSDTVHLKPGEEPALDRHMSSEMEIDFDLGSVLADGEESTSEQTEGTVDFDLGLEGVTDGDELDRLYGPDFNVVESEADGRGGGNTQEVEAGLDFNLDGESVESTTSAEGSVDFDVDNLEPAGSSSSSVGDLAGESGSDETVDLDYSFADDNVSGGELESSGVSKRPDEGTVDFDLGLADARETVRTNAFETGGATGGQDAQPHQEQAEGSADDGALEDPSFRMGEVEGGDLDLELDPEGFTQDDSSDGTVEATTEALPQDRILDEWASLESEAGDDVDRTLVLGKEHSQDLDEIQTKLELAQAYMDMGDAEGARSILDEVLSEGDDEQKEAAKELMSKIA